jgi:hypothetical protein
MAQAQSNGPTNIGQPRTVKAGPIPRKTLGKTKSSSATHRPKIRGKYDNREQVVC